MRTPTVNAPCIDICRFEDGICQGCGRTAWEIADWQSYSPYQRASILKVAKERLSELG